ncbi:unnamed protein product [Cladocopium goreaui]|uniref:Integrase catalytic domain-containing protein n=1 Tax=Cladocopium goreaui TaxID=2562237 RepID=A0A9P1M682_9DINO|nr:unnamed protein product [Cladocopium goreaui]
MVGGQASDGANNSGGAAVPGGPAGATTGPQNGGATANGAQGGQNEFTRGLDSGLAKAAPSAAGLTQSTYRSFRRRLDLFSRQCRRRGQGVALEGAYLVLSQLQDVAWEATEGLDYDDMELSDDPFKPLLVVLDKLFQHEEEVELPERCQEFFEKFARERGEELQAYLVRHQSMLRKLKELQVDIPPLLAGWHLLQRSGVPRWTHVQVKAMCNGDMSVDRVSKALIRMFGGDSKPNAKDSILKGEIHYMDAEYDDLEDYGFDDVYYQDDDAYTYGYDPDYDDTIDEVEYTGEADEDIPQELDEASLAVEDAFINYLDSRKKMRELALSRGFYPVVAIGMDDNGGAFKGRGKASGGKGKSKGKGRGKSSGGKGKSAGKGHPLPGARRYVFGRRRAGESTSTASTTASAKSTTSGSTSQHGPRFKRYRLPANGIKEVPDEVTMVEDNFVSEVNQIPVDYTTHESINFVSQAVGWAIMDSGATRTVCGEASWNKILDYLSLRNMEPDIDKETKDFRFGDGAMVRSLFRAMIPVCVGKTWRQLIAHVLPGHTPLLLARPDLESWQTVVDYGRKTVMIGDVQVKPAFTTNGHYMINIFDDLEDVLSFAELDNIDVSVETFVDSMITDEVSDFEADLDVEVSEKEAEEFVFAASMKSQQHERKLKFWEVYVDEGNLSKYLQRAYHDVEVRQFSLPTWNFEMKEQQAAFRRLVEQEEPHHIMVTPECRLWSPMQNLNYRTPERRELLRDLRVLEEETHLTFYKDIHIDGKRLVYDTTFENPADAASFETPTLDSMKGYFETVLDRCRTKLKASPEDEMYVRKPTRFRSSSRKVCEAVNLRCECPRGAHVQMMGRGSVLKKMQNYEPELCQRLGNAIYSAMEMAWKKRGQAELMTMEVVEKSTEEMQYLEQNKELIKIGGHEILKSVANLHRQLGHPNGAKLVLAVKARHLPNEFVQVARRYKCPTCLARAQPKNVRVATLHKSPHFNHSVAIDTFYVEWDGKQRAVFTIMDEFSRYEVDMEIKEETADMEIALFESTWSRSFGFPKVLRLDASGPHQGQQFADWASAHGMYMDLIPREPDTPGKPADKSKARPKAKLPEPRIDFWVDYPDSEKTESESKTTDKTLLDEMVANKDKNLDDHTQGMTDIQKEMKRKLEEEHPGIMDSSHGVIDRQDDEPPVNPDDVSVRARDRRFYEQAVRAASFLSHENYRRLDGLPPSGRQLPANAAAQASRPAANLIVPVAALEYGFVIFLSFDKIIGFFFFLAFALVFAYTLGKRAGRREVHGLMAATEPTETAEGETQAPPTPRTRAVTDCQRFTAAEISFLLGEGYEVWPDDKVEQIQRDFIAEVVMSSVPDLPVGTILSSSSGRSNG